eukprot:Gregarina_sp_Poly_1__5685@NODE_29_length_19459_cov_103_994070_g26_i0_p12_GENE_NODE_29_length_19459_cov_103_994070_g26_i0NODE_29_length_19459_cov_103_994070_g26_i0_p12_ORF_typecomplete_len120_score17_37Nop16/PF09420_10/4_4e14_NODE_29_length_19459_cov_103_994070_g26_i039854344
MGLSKNKKRHRKPVTRRLWTMRHKRPLHKLIQDDVVRGAWSRTLTVNQNMTKLDPNILVSRMADEYEATRKKLSDSDTKILQKLTEKYQEDVPRMAKDIKINRWQWSEGEITRKLRLLK